MGNKPVRKGVEHFLWDQQDDETYRQYQLFCFYRDLPAHERTLDIAAESAGVKPNYVKKLSSEYSWVARARAYDAHLDEKRKQLDLHYLRKGREDRRKRGEKLQQMGMNVLEGKSIEEVSASEAVSMIKTGSDIYKQAVSDEAQKNNNQANVQVNVDFGSLMKGIQDRIRNTAGDDADDIIDVEGEVLDEDE